MQKTTINCYTFAFEDIIAALNENSESDWPSLRTSLQKSSGNLLIIRRTATLSEDQIKNLILTKFADQIGNITGTVKIETHEDKVILKEIVGDPNIDAKEAEVTILDAKIIDLIKEGGKLSHDNIGKSLFSILQTVGEMSSQITLKDFIGQPSRPNIRSFGDKRVSALKNILGDLGVIVSKYGINNW